MSAAVMGLAVMLAVVTAVRSTWSPCGLSMLSTITPIAEAGRGHNFRTTSLWFVIGSIGGGLTLGGLMAGLAIWAADSGFSPAAASSVITMAALVTAASDGRVASLRLPAHDRQVNERWLDQYRSWVYGIGFGWQIGTGLGTYIMTAGVYLLILMGALSGRPLFALALGATFGLIRGLAVYLTVGSDSVEGLLAFHANFESHREAFRRATIAFQAALAVGATAAAPAPAPILGVVVAVATAIVIFALRGPSEAGALDREMVSRS
jgi:hypothetical protein